MSETITAAATRALGEDFDTGHQAKAERFVREAVLEIYTNTRLARGDQSLTLLNIAATATTLPQTIEGAYFEAMIYADNGEELRPTDLAELLALRAAQPNAVGRPQVFAGHGDFTSESSTIEIWPKADRAYQVFTTGARTPPAADLEAGDTVPLPDAWLKLPYYYARAELFSLLESDVDMDSHWRTLWINGCAAMRSDVQRRLGVSRIVPGTWGNTRSSAPRFHYPGQF